MRAAETYKTIIKDTVKSNEIEKLILQRFQDGILARDLEIRRIYMLSDPEEKDKAFSNLLKRFPPVKFSKPEAENSRFFYTRLFWSVMNNRITSHNDYSLLYEHLPIVPYVVLKDYYYRIVQLPLKHELKTYKELRPYADAIYDEIIKRSKQGEDLYYTDMVHKRFSPAEWEQEVLYEVRGYSLTHAEVLYETGAYEKALEISESIKDYFHGEVSSFNEIYAKLLVANNYPALVVPFIEASIKLDAATPQMLDLLKTDFVKKNPAGNFDQYINKLRSKEYVEKQEEELKNKLINKDIEPFVLEGPNGVVNMEDLKGKVIVLDFWATWCSPCKAAMPGMQMVVDKYKDNPNVAFFFISTLETSPNYKDAIDQFLKEKSYPFNVLYDKDPANNKQGFYYYKYAKAGFGVNGIPHKMVIDRNGKLRWSSGGYFGNPQALANEISFLVDYLLEDSK
jgi:thiol-disulfide isomerase/thioredoxin